ncbi:MAG: NAD(P)-binding protein [bacterium]
MSIPVTILGGGMASLVTAYELSNLKDANDDPTYAITVYQQGWRLGGKGASSRNAIHGDRIEEHGLHVLFGCYENTFRILREIYDTELPKAVSALQQRKEWAWLPKPWTFNDAFEGHDLVVMEEAVGDQWEPWLTDAVAARPGQPGIRDGANDGSQQLDPWHILHTTTDWAIAWAQRIPAAKEGEDGRPPLEPGALLDFVSQEVKRAIEALERGEKPPLQAVAYLVNARALLRRVLNEEIERAEHVWQAAADSLLVVWRWLRLPSVDHAFEHLATLARRALGGLDFILTMTLGLIDDKVLPNCTTWFDIDDYDLRDWLARKGALDVTLRSPIVQGLYAAVFSSDMRPDVERPSRAERLAAGTILHVLLRATHYKGHLFYRMRAGMGETIFTPLYLVLLARGVQFKFFHRVTGLRLSADRTFVARISFERQAAPKPSAPEYVPLRQFPRRAGGTTSPLACWPQGPDSAQLDLPKSLRERLSTKASQNSYWAGLENWWDEREGERWDHTPGEESEHVVLGISVGAFSSICRELIEDRDNPAFADMAASVLTTQTQAAQLWINQDLTALGWPAAGGRAPIVIPFAAPLDTWADMTHLAAQESVSGVKHIAYLCAALWDEEPQPPARRDPGYVARQRARVRGNLVRWLDTSAGVLWPKATTSGKFNRSLLIGGLGKQYSCAVENPSDRYVLAVPGSSAKRLRAHESGYANLYLAGDWTKTALSIGCLEAATMSGIAAARAIDARVAKAAFDWLPDPAPCNPSNSIPHINVQNRS